MGLQIIADLVGMRKKILNFSDFNSAQYSTPVRHTVMIPMQYYLQLEFDLFSRIL